MRKRNRLAVIIVCLVFISPSVNYGLSAGPLLVEGKIKEFDTEKIVLQNPRMEISMPRDFIGKLKVKSGETISVNVLPDQIRQLRFRKRGS